MPLETLGTLWRHMGGCHYYFQVLPRPSVPETTSYSSFLRKVLLKRGSGLLPLSQPQTGSDTDPDLAPRSQWGFWAPEEVLCPKQRSVKAWGRYRLFDPAGLPYTSGNPASQPGVLPHPKTLRSTPWDLPSRWQERFGKTPEWGESQAPEAGVGVREDGGPAVLPSAGDLLP